MASARFAWGIDVGNRALKAVKLVRDGDRLRVDDFELIEHEHVLSNAGDNKDSLIQTALANFVAKHPMKGGIAAVGVSGQSSFARFIKLPPVEPKKIPEIVKFEAIQQIPFPLDDVEWGYQLFQNAESPDVEVGIFAMRKELVNRHIKFFTDVDMNVQVVQMNPLAVYNAMYYDQRLKGTTMVIDLGAENTDLIICDNDSIWMRSIPIGGNNFTETLVKGFRLPFAKAEDLKRNAATSKYARQIFQAMRPVFADLVAEIQRSVGFYASAHRDSRLKKIIALGGTFRLPGLQKYLQQNLSLDVERLDNLGAGAPADPKQAALFNENLLSVVGAYGLAAQAMGEGKVTSSLLPASIRREKLWKEKTPVFGATAAMFCLGTVIALGGYFIGNTAYESSTAKEKREHIQHVQAEASRLDNEWTGITGSGGPDRNIISNVIDMGKYRDLWRNLLMDIQNAVPRPQPEVIEGIRKNDPKLIKLVPRGERKLVTIRSIALIQSGGYQSNGKSVMDIVADAEFAKKYGLGENAGARAIAGLPTGEAPALPTGGGDDLTIPSFELGPDTTAAGPVGGGGADGANRGFIMVIKVTSPNQNAVALIENDFCKALRNIKPSEDRPKMDYEVRRAAIALSGKGDQFRLAELKRTYDAVDHAQKEQIVELQQRAPVAPAVRPVAGQEDPAPYMDRLVPDEDVRGDWDITLVIFVKVGDIVYEPPKPTASAQ